MRQAPELRNKLRKLASVYAELRQLQPSTLSKYLKHSKDFFSDLLDGKPVDFTVEHYDADIEWFSDHWPSVHPWPKSIPRPKSQERKK